MIAHAEAHICKSLESPWGIIHLPGYWVAKKAHVVQVSGVQTCICFEAMKFCLRNFAATKYVEGRG